MELAGLLGELNAQQLSAVEETEGYVRVAAGAGSGKTKVLTARYVYIAKALGVPPEHILSVTFTNKAAWEMKRRIRAYLPDEDGGWILTFHSACHKILKQDISALAYPSNFMVLDEEDQKAILQRIYDENGLTLRDFPFRNSPSANASTPSKYTNRRATMCLFWRIPSARFPRPICRRRAIPARCTLSSSNTSKTSAKTFTSILPTSSSSCCTCSTPTPPSSKNGKSSSNTSRSTNFRTFRASSTSWRGGSRGSTKTCSSWATPTRRGADVRFFLDFEKKFEGAKTIVLDKNYRSTPEILSVSNSLISRNEGRIPKQLQAVRQSGQKPRYRHARSRAEESDALAGEIAALREKGMRLSDIAVIYRGNYMSRAIEEALVRKKIPYEIYSGTAFYQRREIKDALSYLRLLVFGDDVSFLRVVNVPARGIGKTRQNMLQEVAESKNVSRLCALRELAEHPLFKGTKARELLALLGEAKEFSRENDLADTLDFLLQRSGYEGYLRLCGNQDRLDNLNELKASVREAVDSAGEEVNAEDYLNGISLITSADAEDKKECVKLMTVHTAKGLEFPAVFVCCLNEGLFPSRKIRTREEMEEERRVAYVALTRAESLLYLSDAEGFDANCGGNLYTSRFLFDIDKDLLEASGAFSEGHLARSKSYIKKSELSMGIVPASEQRFLFKAGDKVRHPHFGAGVVLDFGGGAYTVEFESGKTRSVSAASDLLIPFYERKS